LTGPATSAHLEKKKKKKTKKNKIFLKREPEITIEKGLSFFGLELAPRSRTTGRSLHESDLEKDAYQERFLAQPLFALKPLLA
jgi:hypothetical protein